MENSKKTGVVGSIAGDMKESTKNIHAINKANMAAVKADSKANFEEATTPSPEFVEFKETKGLRNKAKVVARHIKEGAKANSEKEKEKREQLKKHESYENLLAEQREKRQAVVAKK